MTTVRRRTGEEGAAQDSHPERGMPATAAARGCAAGLCGMWATPALPVPPTPTRSQQPPPEVLAATEVWEGDATAAQQLHGLPHNLRQEVERNAISPRERMGEEFRSARTVTALTDVSSTATWFQLAPAFFFFPEKFHPGAPGWLSGWSMGLLVSRL